MDNLIKDMRENLNSYFFKVVIGSSNVSSLIKTFFSVMQIL